MKKFLLILVLIVVSVLGANAQYAFMWTIHEDGVYNGDINIEDVELKITHVKTGCFVTEETSISVFVVESFLMCDVTELTNCAPGLTVGDLIRFELKLKSSGKKADVTVAIPDNRSFDGDMYIEAEKPTIAVTAGVEMCAGEAGKTVVATITNGPADMTPYTIDWGINGISTSGALSPTGGSGIIDPAVLTSTQTGTVKLMKDGILVATADVPYIVTVNNLPQISLSGTTVCSGAEITFTASGATSYSWSGDVEGTKSSVKKTYTTPGDVNYTVTVANTATNCAATKNGTITVYELPVVATLTASANDACKDTQVTLTATASGGGGYTYMWSNGTNETTGSLKPTLALAGDNKYSVKVKDQHNCTSTQAKEVTVVGHAVTVSIDGPVSANYGEAVTLTAKPQYTPAGATPDSYNWTGAIDGPNDGEQITTTALTANSNYQVTVQDNFGCSGLSAVKTVVVNGSALSLAPTGGGTYCSAEFPITLNAGISGGSGDPECTWVATPVGLTLSGDHTETPQITAGTGGTYDIELTVKSGAETKQAHVEVVIKESPVLSDWKATPAAIAVGESSQLSVNVAPEGAVCTWTGSPATTPEKGTSVSTGILTAAKTYTYKVKAENDGCYSAEQAVTVTVSGDNQLAIVLPDTPPAGIVDQPIDAEVGVSGGDGNNQFEWTTDEEGVTIVDKGDGKVTITSSTPGVKNVCVTVTSGGKTVHECFNVIVSDGQVSLALTVDEKCAYEGEELTISVVGFGADFYSFILRDQSNNPVLTVVNQKTWGTHKVKASAAGTYKITDFKYKIQEIEYNGTAPEPVKAIFNPIPNVYAMIDQRPELINCKGDMAILTASGEAGLEYKWDRGVKDGEPFLPVEGTYTVTGTNPLTGCKNTSSVVISVHTKPKLDKLESFEACANDLITLKATGTGADRFVWDNGVVNGEPFRVTTTTTYQVRAIDDITNDAACETTDEVTVTVNPQPHIVRTSRNPRNIAIGKDVYFAVTAEGGNLSYQWKRKENNTWVVLQNSVTGKPIIAGADTDSLRLMSVPQSWDGSEFRCVVSGHCGKDSTEFQLGVKECFTIEAELVMMDGITPDETVGNKIDGWYCRGQKIALKAIIHSEEGYAIENAHYKWSIDGLDLPEEHVEMESDTAVLTWVPQFQEDDMVIKVCVYCDGACEEVCAKYIRLKAREFENVSMRILSDRDPSHRFCAGDTVNFWIAAKNAGEKPEYTWYNDVFRLPDEQSPKNELIHCENDKVTLVLGQEDTWMRVEMIPSTEVCVKEIPVVDTVFMKKKTWVEPSLQIDCADTLVCKGDSVAMQVNYANVGENPTFQWQRSVGEPFPDWNLGTKTYAIVHVDEEDVWVKCTMKPGDDVCYDKTKLLVDAVKISVLKQDAEVTIFCDMENKKMGDELVFESEVKNILGTYQYEWYINERMAPEKEEDFISSDLEHGDIVYCLVNGEKICQTRVKSNEIKVDYGRFNRDTMLVIYKNETIKDLNMLKEGDILTNILFMIEVPGKFGMASISPDGKFTYIPNTGFVGTDDVKYKIVNRVDKTVVAEGYIYITVKENDRFFVPNLITPNNDGLNDTWVLDFIAEYPNHLIRIFDRNSKLVFEARNYQNDWDGTGLTKGGYVGHINLINGIYTYVIDLGDKDRTILKSWIEIRANLNRRDYR